MRSRSGKASTIALSSCGRGDHHVIGMSHRPGAGMTHGVAASNPSATAEAMMVANRL